MEFAKLLLFVFCFVCGLVAGLKADNTEVERELEQNVHRFMASDSSRRDPSLFSSYIPTGAERLLPYLEGIKREDVVSPMKAVRCQIRDLKEDLELKPFIISF